MLGRWSGCRVFADANVLAAKLASLAVVVRAGNGESGLTLDVGRVR